MVKICSPASITEIFVKSSNPGYIFTRSSFTKSCNSAANSTPVGPPPTITKWRFFFLSSSVRFGRLALSKHSTIFRRIFWASSTSCEYKIRTIIFQHQVIEREKDQAFISWRSHQKKNGGKKEWTDKESSMMISFKVFSPFKWTEYFIETFE